MPEESESCEIKKESKILTKPINPKKTNTKTKEPPIPRGMPKSRRPWKTQKKKFTTVKKSLNRLSFEKKQELRNDLKHIKELSREIKDQRKQAAVDRNQRRIQNAERRLENERRAEIVQVIKNPAKLKRMRKKQLRSIQKRDLDKVKVV